MLDEKWEQYFSPDVLSRGYRYFEEGCVTHIKPTSIGWEATVEGHENYFVFVGHNFDKSSCDCPYFEDRGNCKHIAAACYEIEYSLLPDKGQTQAAEQGPDPFELAKSLDESTRLAYLLEILQNDPDWREDIVRRFGDIDAERLKRDFVEGVCQVVRENSYRGFVDYRNARRCEHALNVFVREFLDPLFSRQAYRVAFQLTCEFALTLQKVAIDDSDGFFDSMLDLCVSYWKRLAEQGDRELKRSMFDWVVTFIESDDDDHDDEAGIIWFVKKHAEEFAIEAFASDPQLTSDVEALADRIIGLERETLPPVQETANDTPLHFIPSRLITWAKAKIRCMNTRNASAEDIDQFVLECPPELDIVQPLVDSAVAKGNPERAIQLLEQFKARNESGRFSTSASLQLRKLYDETGRSNDARNELFALCVKGRAQNDEQFRSWIGKLRERCGGKWPVYEDRLINELSKEGGNEYRLHAALAACGKLDELMAALEAFESRYEFDRYRKDLAPRFPERYLKSYEQDIRKELFGRAQPRKIYELNVWRMRQMLEIPGGEAVVRRLVCELHEKFSRRTALIDELSRLPL